MCQNLFCILHCLIPYHCCFFPLTLPLSSRGKLPQVALFPFFFMGKESAGVNSNDPLCPNYIGDAECISEGEAFLVRKEIVSRGKEGTLREGKFKFKFYLPIPNFLSIVGNTLTW